MSWESCSVASCADRRGAPTPTILTPAGSEFALLLIDDMEGQRRQRRRRRAASTSQWGRSLGADGTDRGGPPLGDITTPSTNASSPNAIGCKRVEQSGRELDDSPRPIGGMRYR